MDPPPQKKYRVKFAFKGETQEEASVGAGDLLLALVEPRDGWVRVRSLNDPSTEGFVPLSYLEEAVAATPPSRPAPMAAPARAAPKAPGVASITSVPPPAITSPANANFGDAWGATSYAPTNVSSSTTNDFDVFASNFSASTAPSTTASLPKTTVSSQSLAASAAAAASRLQPPPPAPGGGRQMTKQSSSSSRSASGGARYGSAQPGFLQPPLSESTALHKSSSSSSTNSRGGASGTVDRSSINFQETLGVWRERERRFILGEQERLPKVKEREYYYWDRSGKRHGPFTDAEMRAHFDRRTVTSDTMITLSTTSMIAEQLPVRSVNEYFPNVLSAFETAPIAPPNSEMWQYVDDNGVIQGPFPAAQMREWFQDGYFNAETKARLADRPDVPFAPLGILFPEGEGAFLSPGNQDAAIAYVAPPALIRSPSHADTGRELLGMALGGNEVNPFLSSPAPATSSQQQQDDVWGSDGWGYVPPVPDALAPVPASEFGNAAAGGNIDDWGVTWDDEKEERAAAGSGNDAELAIAVPVAEHDDSIKVARFAEIKAKFLGSHDALYRFLTRALPKDLGTVRCKIRRSMVGMMHINYNVYELFLEMDDGKLGPQIMVANKYKRMGYDSYFQLSIGSVLPTHSGVVIAEETMTTMGYQFLLHNDVKGHQGVAKDLACITYLKNTNGGGPRKMQVAIPAFSKGSEVEFVEWAHAGGIKKSPLMNAFVNLQFTDIQPLANKPPVWNAKRGAWTLNFHGRVSRPSVKNFQLVRPEDHDHVVLQHGRVGSDTFTMDMSWPISPVQAFAVCLSSLHGKLGVE